MTLEEVMNLEPGTIVGTWSSVQILKKISDGYIVLGYEDAHNVYYTDFKSFDDIMEFHPEIVTESYMDDIFDGENIKSNPKLTDSYLPIDTN